MSLGGAGIIGNQMNVVGHDDVCKQKELSRPPSLVDSIADNACNRFCSEDRYRPLVTEVK